MRERPRAEQTWLRNCFLPAVPRRLNKLMPTECGMWRSRVYSSNGGGGNDSDDEGGGGGGGDGGDGGSFSRRGWSRGYVTSAFWTYGWLRGFEKCWPGRVLK